RSAHQCRAQAQQRGEQDGEQADAQGDPEPFDQDRDGFFEQVDHRPAPRMPRPKWRSAQTNRPWLQAPIRKYRMPAIRYRARGARVAAAPRTAARMSSTRPTRDTRAVSFRAACQTLLAPGRAYQNNCGRVMRRRHWRRSRPMARAASSWPGSMALKAPRKTSTLYEPEISAMARMPTSMGNTVLIRSS